MPQNQTTDRKFYRIEGEHIKFNNGIEYTRPELVALLGRVGTGPLTTTDVLTRSDAQLRKGFEAMLLTVSKKDIGQAEVKMVDIVHERPIKGEADKTEKVTVGTRQERVPRTVTLLATSVAKELMQTVK